MFMTDWTPPPPPPQKPITVWVHGTRPSTLMPESLDQQVKKSIDSLSLCPPGLNHASTINPASRHCTAAHVLSRADPQQFPIDSFYLFGWSGELDTQARKDAAQVLYNALKQLITDYFTQYGSPPLITIISHSHGGNVVLNLATLCEENELWIERLVLMACPVQRETAHLIAHGMFKKIYALYSRADLVQVMDPQRLHPFREIAQQFLENKKPSVLKSIQEAYLRGQQNPLFSERHFPERTNLVHISLSWAHAPQWSDEDLAFFGNMGPLIKGFTRSFDTKQRGLLHTEFVMPTFIKQIPHILAVTDSRLLPNSQTPHISLSL